MGQNGTGCALGWLLCTWVAYSPNPSIEAGHKAAQTPSVLVKARGEGGSLEGGRVTAGSALGKGFEPTDRGM